MTYIKLIGCRMVVPLLLELLRRYAAPEFIQQQTCISSVGLTCVSSECMSSVCLQTCLSSVSVSSDCLARMSAHWTRPGVNTDVINSYVSVRGAC